MFLCRMDPKNEGKTNESIKNSYLKQFTIVDVYFDIDIEKEIVKKMEVNEGRPFKHNKKC